MTHEAKQYLKQCKRVSLGFRIIITHNRHCKIEFKELSLAGQADLLIKQMNIYISHKKTIKQTDLTVVVKTLSPTAIKL